MISLMPSYQYQSKAALKSIGYLFVGWFINISLRFYLFVYLLAQIKNHTIISTDNKEIVLIGHKGAMSTYGCPQ